MGRKPKSATAPATPGGHEERAHAWASPSALSRVFACPASCLFESVSADTPAGPAAAWGTAAHEQAEKHLRAWTDPLPVDEHAGVLLPYLAHVRSLAGGRNGAALGRELLVEKRLDIYPPDCFGTLDAGVVDPFDHRIDVVDLKTGAGHAVSPEENAQLGAYAIGLLHRYGGKRALWHEWTVALHIVQPRRSDGGDPVQTWTAPRLWAPDLLARIKAAVKASRVADPKPIAGAHCEWCKAAGKCPARLAQAAQVFPLAGPDDVGGEEPATVIGKAPDPRLLDSATKVRIWRVAPEIRAFLDAVDAELHANPPDGFKLVEGRRGARKWTDPATAVAALRGAGLEPHEAPSVKSPSAVEKEIGKSAFASTFAPLVVSPPGKPTLVPADDPRPAISFAGAFPAESANATPAP